MKAHFINTPFILLVGDLEINFYSSRDDLNKFKVLRSKEKWHTTVIAVSRLTQAINRFSIRNYGAVP